jgi:putative peptide zinc metalloprotease protein
MPDIATIPPSGPPNLLLRALGEPGRSVTDPRHGADFPFGEQEHSQRCQLDGVRAVVAVCRAFEEGFDEPLSTEDLDQLDELVRGFILPDEETAHLARQVGAAPFRVSLGAPRIAGADTRSACIGVPGTAGPAEVRTTSTAVEAGTEESVPDKQTAPAPPPLASAMPEVAPPLIPPARRPDLLLRPLGEQGRYVVKDPRTGAYFTLGEQESFLLCQLDGVRDAGGICRAFQERFGEPLSADDLGQFVKLARSRGFLLPPEETARPAQQAGADTLPAPAPKARQSLLSWRLSLFDPDRLFTRWAPRLGFLWTRAFFVTSAVCILLAAGLAWANRNELVSSFARAWRWETLALAWLTLVVVTTLHEFAHGLTCKHHGGEVHEVGFLMLFFMPCFYCNVSDAWLFKDKSKRLWVTAAGAWCDLCLWALAVFAWRLTLPNSLLNYLAWVVLTVLGARVFFNLNPLLKLDGYYLLGDWLEVPNLRQRSWGYVAGHLRRLLWGAPRPAREPRGRLLLVYGVTSWLFSMAFLALMLWGFYRFLASWSQPAGLVLVATLGGFLLPGMFRGLGGGEVWKMILFRRKRTVLWLLALGGLAASLVFVEVEDRASGPFQLRPAARAELRAPVAGFLRVVYFDEGDRVPAGAVVAWLEIPDLESRLAQSKAAIRESQAKLRLLEVGPRPEELREQRYRVERAKEWSDLAEKDLDRARKALAEDLKRLDEDITQRRIEEKHAREVLARRGRLVGTGAVGGEEQEEVEKRVQLLRAQEQQARARKRAREALGTREEEAELAKRRKELADAQATLTLMEAGTRPEEIEAERARLARLQEETRYLEGLQGKLSVCCPVSGLVTTPRLKEKAGQYLHEGDLICQVEEPAVLEAEVALPEQDVADVEPGQVVTLKVRSLPFETFTARVTRVAPSAARPEPQPLAPTVKGELPGTVTIYCELPTRGTALRPGMTGYARIACGKRPLGELLGGRILRFLRTEFWW